MNKESTPYRALCTKFYDLDKPFAPEDALQCYLRYAEEANGPILEPTCGTGRFPLICGKNAKNRQFLKFEHKYF